MKIYIDVQDYNFYKEVAESGCPYKNCVYCGLERFTGGKGGKMCKKAADNFLKNISTEKWFLARRSDGSTIRFTASSEYNARYKAADYNAVLIKQEEYSECVKSWSEEQVNKTLCID